MHRRQKSECRMQKYSWGNAALLSSDFSSRVIRNHSAAADTSVAAVPAGQLALIKAKT